jgi:hypothetical protein
LAVWAVSVRLALLARVAEVGCSVGYSVEAKLLALREPLLPELLLPPLPLLELVVRLPPLPPPLAGSSRALTSATSHRSPWLCLVRRRRT